MHEACWGQDSRKYYGSHSCYFGFKYGFDLFNRLAVGKP